MKPNNHDEEAFPANWILPKCLQTDQNVPICCESSSGANGEVSGLTQKCCPYLLKLIT